MYSPRHLLACPSKEGIQEDSGPSASSAPPAKRGQSSQNHLKREMCAPREKSTQKSACKEIHPVRHHDKHTAGMHERSYIFAGF